MKKLLFIALFLASVLCASAQKAPKREFRGAWLHVIGPVKYTGKTTDQTKAFIIDKLDKLQQAGCNAVIFQVRPCADALYQSEFEPWSQ